MGKCLSISNGGRVVDKMLCEKLDLSLMINRQRKVMYKKAKDFGFTHPSVVQCSQELDAMLNRYQHIRM